MKTKKKGHKPRVIVSSAVKAEPQFVPAAQGEPVCWKCGAPLDPQAVDPFFCRIECGYEWALQNAINLQKVKEKYA